MLQTIGHLQQSKHEAEYELDPNRDAVYLLCHAAEDASRIHRGRYGASLLLQELTGNQNVVYAKSLVAQSMMMKIDDGKFVRSDMDYSKDIWLGVKRSESGGFIKEIVLVQNDVTVFDNLGRIIVEKGTCVEAVTIDKNYANLRESYRAGISVAEVISDGRTIFGLETVADEDNRPGLLGKILGKPIIDPQLVIEIADAFSKKSDPNYHVRSDLGISDPIYSQIFYA